MIKYLKADEILGADDVKETDVDVPEWGGTVRIRELVAADRDWLQATLVTDEGAGVVRVGKGDAAWDLANFRIKLAALSIIDPETHERLFDYNQISKLGQKSSAAIDRIVSAVFALNKLGEEETKKLGEDSGQTDIAASSSVSPSPSEKPSGS